MSLELILIAVLNAGRRAVRMLAKLMAMADAGILGYWLNSASQVYVERIEAGEFVTVVAGASEGL